MEVGVTVAKEHVHKRAEAEVFVDSVTVGVETPHQVSISVPARHHRVRNSTVLPLIVLIESLRQAGMAYTTHMVSADTVFVIDRINVECGNLPNVNAVDEMFRMRATIEEKHSEKNKLSTVITIPDLCVGVFDYRMLTKRVYERLRTTDSPMTTMPTINEDALIIGEQWLMGWDSTDSMIFDHAVDHVPGMAVIDTALAAAKEWGVTSPHFVDAIFESYMTLVDPIVVVHENEDRFLFLQNGVPGAHVTVR